MVCFMISWNRGTFLTSMVLKIDAVVFVGIQCKSTACIPKSYCNTSHRTWYSRYVLNIFLVVHDFLFE